MVGTDRGQAECKGEGTCGTEKRGANRQEHGKVGGTGVGESRKRTCRDH